MPYFAKINNMILNRYKWTESWLKHQNFHEINGIIMINMIILYNELSDWSRSHVTGQNKTSCLPGNHFDFLYITKTNLLPMI